MTEKEADVSKTDENLETAINGEARARLKYTAFALQAMQEGHPEIAAAMPGYDRVRFRSCPQPARICWPGEAPRRVSPVASGDNVRIRGGCRHYLAA